MKKKLNFALVVILAATTILSGCNSKEPDFKGENTSEEVENTSESKDLVNNEKGQKSSAKKESEKSKNSSKSETDDWVSLKDNEKSSDISPDSSATVHVKNARELLAAIAPDTHIVLEPGKYNLSEVIEETGFSGYESYIQPTYGYGTEISICDVDNLEITGPADAGTEIVVTDPTVSTLCFYNCENITISNVTAGHDVEKGTCSGSVLRFDHCINTKLYGNDLYGCGTYGVEAYSCSGIVANDCTIRECTYGIVSTYLCSDTSFNNCTFKKCEDLDLIYTSDSSIEFNKCDFAQNSTNYDFINRYSNSSVIFKGCSFGNEETARINELNDFTGAVYFDKDCKFDGNFLLPYVTVSNAKELFEAIKPGVTICVEPGTYNLTECAYDILESRGNSWLSTHKYISFEEEFDGVEVVLNGVNDLTIYGLGDNPADVEFIVDPRYAAVFKLINCLDISFVNLTAGHTDRGTCVGDVITIEKGNGFVFDNVDLYGCGVNGIGAYSDFSDIYVFDSVIHDCSDSPLCLYGGSGNVALLNTSLYGCASPGGYGEGDYNVYFQKCDFGIYESLGLNPINDEAAEKITTFACTFADTTEYEDYAYEW